MRSHLATPANPASTGSFSRTIHTGHLAIAAPEWLPTDPPRPAPAVMTAEEAAIYLRLDVGRDIGDAMKSLEYLIAQGWLRPARIGKSNRIARGVQRHR